MSNLRNRIITGLTLFGIGQILDAQSSSKNEPVDDLAPFTVTATARPTRPEDIAVPISVLPAEALESGWESNLGDTLSGLPGMHATSFGGGASRPVIRGFDGPRVKVVESGLDSQDVSSASPDHAVTIEPLFAEAIEVVRGPATLLYGGSAIGGVVNVRDGRIAREVSEDRFTTRLSGRYTGGSNGYDVAGLTTIGFSNFSLRLSGMVRDHEDYQIPGFAETALFMSLEEEEHGHDDEDDEHHDDEHGHEEEEDEESVRDVLENSFVESVAGSAALSWFSEQGHRVSLAIFSYESDYGVPGHHHHHEEEDHGDDEHDDGEHSEDEHVHEEDEDGVVIDLDQLRLDLDAQPSHKA